ncbi:hypothetical protein O3P69_015606 [Scylla paramamosain]|uniref:Uncharacterized protein n=1 Tax=Scylla paramamosain TaxID=85552 RepID=A0AAW0SJ07_SCYPA
MKPGVSKARSFSVFCVVPETSVLSERSVRLLPCQERSVASPGYVRATHAPHSTMATNPHHDMEEFREILEHQPTTDLVIAVQEGDEAGVRSALDRGARPEVTFATTAGTSWNLLSMAASEGHDHLLPHLLQAGLSIEGGGTTDMTPLMVAAQRGHTQTMKALLDLGGNPLATNRTGWTALHLAAEWGHQQCVAALIPVTPPTPAHLTVLTPVHVASYNGQVEVLEQLASASWSLTARDSDGDTPMHYAATEGSVTCLQWLEQQGCDPRVQNNAGHTPLDQELVTAVWEGDEARVRSALDRGAGPEVTVPSNDGVSCSLLTLAASEGHDHLLSHLLQAGLSIEGGGTTDRTPLMMAAQNGHAHTVKALLDLRGNPLARDSGGRTALYFAAWQGHQQCVAALLSVTPPVPAHLEANTPVHAASYRGHMEVLEQLAGAGWPLTVRESHGNTPMHLAVAGGSVRCVQWLVQRGGDTSKQNNAGHTPLDQELVTAVRKGDEAGVRSALDRGARPEVTVPTNAGMSCSLLTLAAREGHEHLLSHLLQAGLSIEGGGTTDRTPLMMAAQNGHAHTVKALLDLRGNPLAMDSRGRTALHFAAWQGHQQCVAVLLPITPPTPAHLEANTPVHAASYRGHVEVLEQLAGAGWPLNARDSHSNTPMHLAVAGGSVRCVQWLVQRGGDTSKQNNAGHTPLDQELVTAVREGDEAGVRSALDRGAQLEVTVPTNAGGSWNLVTLAASEGHEHLLSHLLLAGLSVEGGGTTDRTPLMMAALHGHAHTVKSLLDLRGNPLAMDNDGRTALHFAAWQGHQQCVAALLPVTPPTPAYLEAYTPVHAASYRGHVEVLEQLAGAGWSLNAWDSDGDTPMHLAVAGGSVTCVQWLVQRGGDTSMQNNAGHTPLDQELVTAVQEGDEAGVRSALDRGARPEVTVPTNDGVSCSLLTLAAREGHDHLLSHLLQAGLSIEDGGTTDSTPLMMAAQNGHAHTVKALLDLRGNPLATDRRGRTALHFAAWQGHQQCVAVLLPVTPPTPALLEADTPVHAASHRGHVEVLEQLADAGWPLTNRDSNGDTPMHLAVSGGCVAAVQWLVQRGCDPHVQTKDGLTPEELAVQCGRHEVETWLVKNCSGVVRSKTLRVEEVRAWRGKHEHLHNTVLSMLVEGNEAAMGSIPEVNDGHTLSQDGLTPLHAAALCGAPSDAVEALLRRGVSPHVTTPDNMTPADLARQQGHDSVIKGLQRHHCAQSYKLPEELHEELLSTVSRQDDVQAVSTLLCKGAPIEPLGGLSVLRLAVTTDRIHTVSLLLASGAPLPPSLLQEAWQSPDVTYRVLAFLTTAYCCRLRAEQRRLEKVSSALVEGIDNLVTTIEGNTPWQAAWRWGKETDRPALSDLLAKAAAANCPVTAAFLHRAGGWTVFNGASGGTALHAALEAGHKGMAELLIRALGGCPYVPDTHSRLPVHMIPHEEQQRLEQKLFMAEREKLENMELRLKADHEKTAARTALFIQEDLFESYKKGEGKNASSPDGRAALLLASRKGLLQLTHLILQEGHFPVDEVLDHTCGTTALHQATSHGQDGCVALLLSHGANPQQRDTYGQTPRHLAAMFGHKSTFELLAHQETQDPPCRAGTTATQVCACLCARVGVEEGGAQAWAAAPASPELWGWKKIEKGVQDRTEIRRPHVGCAYIAHRSVYTVRPRLRAPAGPRHSTITPASPLTRDYETWPQCTTLRYGGTVTISVQKQEGSVSLLGMTVHVTLGSVLTLGVMETKTAYAVLL